MARTCVPCCARTVSATWACRPVAIPCGCAFRSAEERGQARDLIEREFDQLVLEEVEGAELELRGTIGEQEALEIRRFALQQNITTLRNRVNELGVAEPVIQQQGDSRIVVQLPGVQDTVAAKNILGATATLEYRAVDFRGSVEDAVAGRVPAGSRLYHDRDGQPVLLRQQVIVTGDQIVNARSGLDQQGGGPMVSVTLDSRGAKRMLDFTKDNVGNPMAVVFIENRTVTREVDGELVTSTRKVEEVISVATIRGVFGRNFQTTGLDSPREAHELALLLRAGALAAPINIIEERTVGPSMGKENIDQGFKSVVIGFALVLLYMAFYYKVFGLVANLALALNLVIIVAVLSMLQATLTLPGIAGIVLTVGMAVDANVLIFERIREELRNGNSPQAAIHAGYEKGLLHHRRRQYHHPDCRRRAVQFRNRPHQGLRRHPVHRHHHVHVHRHHGHPRGHQPDLWRPARDAPVGLGRRRTHGIFQERDRHRLHGHSAASRWR
jgi:preprotein translocase subunit SecD